MLERSVVWVSFAVSVAALGLVAFLLLTDRSTGSSAPSRPSAALDQAPATVQPPPPAPAAVRATPGGDETGQAPAPPTPPASPQRAAAPGPVDEATFWRLIAETRAAAGNDTARQSELLEERLRRLSPRGIVEFWQIRRRLDRRAYTWRLWGAATVIEDGCSDDCFRDFRAYLISLGRDPYERALRDPDSLASVARGAEAGDWENADDVAADAYSGVTGNDFPFDDSNLEGRPAGRALNLDGADLRRRYSRLAARFR